MAEFTLGYREVITDEDLYEKWIEITLTTGQHFDLKLPATLKKC